MKNLLLIALLLTGCAKPIAWNDRSRWDYNGPHGPDLAPWAQAKADCMFKASVVRYDDYHAVGQSCMAAYGYVQGD